MLCSSGPSAPYRNSTGSTKACS
ncbi:MAG: hypothetical protein AVDCRST_MAG95-390, partial [uncultured Adhaeribacter sp.]